MNTTVTISATTLLLSAREDKFENDISKIDCDQMRSRFCKVESGTRFARTLTIDFDFEQVSNPLL